MTEWKEELKNFSDQKVSRVEDSAREHIAEEGRGWSRDMAVNKKVYTAGYSEDSLIQLLKLIRRKLEDEGFIRVEEEEGSNPNATRKMWILESEPEKEERGS